MFNVPQHFAELNKSSIESVLRFAQISLNNAERLINLQITATKASLEENIQNAKALTASKDAQEFLSLSTRVAQANVEKSISYSRHFYESATQAQAELTQLTEESLASFNKGVVAAADRAVASAPAGTDAAVAALKSTVAATTAAIDNITKITKQAAGFADASVKAATSITANAMKGPKKAA